MFLAVCISLEEARILAAELRRLWRRNHLRVDRTHAPDSPPGHRRGTAAAPAKLNCEKEHWCQPQSPGPDRTSPAGR